MSAQSFFYPGYVPKIGDVIEVTVSELSPNPIPYRVTQLQGSLKQRKVVLLCNQGEGASYANIQLIWKEGMDSWMCWLAYKQYRYVRIRKV